MLNKKLISSLIIISTIICFQNCNTTEPGNDSLSLSVEDVSCTEAWIKLEIKNTTLPVQLSLYANDGFKAYYNISTNVTTLYIDSLLPNKMYTVKAQSSSSKNQTSNIQLTTLDTTSNNFTWQTFTFGDLGAGSSSLNNVAIVNDTMAYSVGKVYLNDFFGQPDPFPYNLLKRNGEEWKLNKVSVVYNGNQTVAPLFGIFILQDGKIILSSGLPYLPNGSDSWRLYHLWDMGVLNQNDGSVYNIWGTSINNLYFVGNKGTIVHYINGSWKKIESGTNYFLNDIYGDNKGNIYICGILDSNSSGNILVGTADSQFKILANSRILSENQLFHPDLYGEIASVFVDNTNTLYAAGNLLFRYKFGKWDYVKSLPENFIGGNRNVYYRGFITKVRGKSANDLWIIGDRNTVRHFNGVTWKQIGMPYDPNSNIIWQSIDIKDNSIIIVGSSGGKAIIMMIKK